MSTARLGSIVTPLPTFSNWQAHALVRSGVSRHVKSEGNWESPVISVMSGWIRAPVGITSGSTHI